MSRTFNPPQFSPRRWAAAAVLSALGAAAFSFTLATGLKARSWAATPAKMTACEQVQHRKGNHQLRVRYEYTFNGRQYTGTRLGFTDGASNGDLAARYAAGGDVVCFVNPNDPRRALLRRDMSLIRWFLPGTFLLAAGGLGYGAKRALDQQRIADAATLYSLESAGAAGGDTRNAA